MSEKRRVSVLVVDDSAVVREVMSTIVGMDPELEVMGTASDPIFALEKMKHRWPDVIVLDIEMPRMDGITFLRKLAAEHPTPVVICSAYTEKQSGLMMQALSLGAVEVITKPKLGVKDYLNESSALIIEAIKGAAKADLRALTKEMLSPSHPSTPPPTKLRPAGSHPKAGNGLIVVGASTGGTTAIETILDGLPADIPGMLIVQHMPEKFTKAFADRLNQRCRLEVKEAAEGDDVFWGRVLIAPGNRHMRMAKSGPPRVEIFDGPLVNRHRPAVDVLFESVSLRPNCGAVLGIILTGMGSDGSRGMLMLKENGAETIGQDKDSSVVYGMPAEAFKIGAVKRVMALDKIAEAILQYAAAHRG